MNKLVDRLLRGLLRHSPVLARVFHFCQPTILLLSYPRSGSSWVGEVLATSPSVAYLREPVTQPFVRFTGREAMDPITDEEAHKAYVDLALNAFHGIPPIDAHCLGSSVLDFYPLRRSRKRLLIKEVNPHATSFYKQRFNPFFVLLLRHPAAVALSFMKQGWLNSDGIEVFGRNYGEVMSHSIAKAPQERLLLVFYEGLATAPKSEFMTLYQNLGLRIPDGYDDMISLYCEGKKKVGSPFETKRNSASQINKWRERLTEEQIESLRKGYFDSPLEFYREASDWGAK